MSLRSPSSLWLLPLVVASMSCSSASSPALIVADRHDAVFDTRAGKAMNNQAKVRITNGGTQATPLLTVELSGDVSAFSLDGDECSGRVLDGQQSCTIGVKFDDAVAGDYQGELRVSAPGLPVGAEVLLSGKIAPAALAFAMPSYAFDVVQGTTRSEPLLLINVGGANSGPIALGSTSPFPSLATAMVERSPAASNAPSRPATPRRSTAPATPAPPSRRAPPQAASCQPR